MVKAERPITIADLLGHTSGMTYGLFGDTPVDSMYTEADVFSGLMRNQLNLTAFPALFQIYKTGERVVDPVPVPLVPGTGPL